MSELSRHIVSLLVDHNCVVIPHFGGFVAQDSPAVYVKEENLFLPPYRTVAFNPLLQTNDGLLATSYMAAEQASYADALHLIEAAVSELRCQLQKQGAAIFDGIGTLSLSLDGHYDFTPIDGGIVAPHHYGLDALYVPLLPEEQPTETVAASPTAPQTARSYYELRIPKRAAHYAAVACAILVCCFTWIAPHRQSACTGPQEAQVLDHVAQLLAPPADTTHPTVSAPVHNIHSKATPISPKINDLKPGRPKALSQAPAPISKIMVYTIVLASQVPYSGAENLVKTLHTEGLNHAFVHRTNRMTRVLFGRYPTKEHAMEALRQQRNTHKIFAQAWVLQDEIPTPAP